LAIQWKDIRDVFFLNSAHEDVLVEAPSSRGHNHKIKPAAVLDYKYGVEKSDQMLLHYSFEMKTIKLWKKLFFHLFDLAVVNVQILHYKSSKKNMSLEISYEKVAEVLLANDGTEIQVQVQTSSPAGSLVGGDHSVYSIPETHAKLEEKSHSRFS
jgi:hypothetical protein